MIKQKGAWIKMNETNLPFDKLLAAAARSLGTKPSDLKNAAETGSWTKFYSMWPLPKRKNCARY